MVLRLCRVAVILLGVGLVGFCHSAKTQADDLRLNDIQTIGTHNSYRLAPPPSVLGLIRLFSPTGAKALDYSHAPLTHQLSELRVRQLELDVYADPKGGLFADPIAGRAAATAGELGPQAGALERDRFMKQPGMKILHSPDYDCGTTQPTLVSALQEISLWSQNHRDHIPLLILLELKTDVVGPSNVQTVPFDAAMLDAVDAEIRSVLGPDQILCPDDVRGERTTLREAVLQDGWPKLADCRGKIWFALDNTDAIRERYLRGHASLAGRVMFASVGTEHSASAFLKLNDPLSQSKKIRSAVRQGFIVRTRADEATFQSRNNDPSRREAAFSSGAQYISTDYPVPDLRWSPYQVQLPGEAVWRRSPLR